jgi:hypothetical protein
VKKKIILCLCALVCAAAAAQENLAILPFTGGAAGEGETIAELFSFNGELKQVFSVIHHTTINQAISVEQRFQMGTGMTNPDTIAAIGRQFGAKYMVTGDITTLGNRKLLIISILKIDELRLIARDIQTYARIEEIRNKLPGMARNIIAAVRRGPSRLDKLAVPPVKLDDNKTDPRVADTLAQILSICLTRSGKYLVYPRTEAALTQIQAEYNTQLSGDTADEQIVDMGRGDNPDLVLSVKTGWVGNLNVFNASVLNLETGVQVIGGSVKYTSLNNGIYAMETLVQELTGVKVAAVSRSAGAIAGYGALNLAAGLGSFVQRDWAGGVTLLAGYGAAAGLLGWEMSLKYEDALAGVPGMIGIGVAGVTAVYGFIRPVLYERNRRLTGIADRVDLAPVPGDRGVEALRLSYTLRF